jgi:hypothetical protein
MPLIATPQRAGVISKILNETIKLETIFTDYIKNEEARKVSVARSLTAPDSYVWEVWEYAKGLPVDIVGIIYLTKIRRGQDAVAHYVFFDKDLLGKTPLLKQILAYVFEDHEGWDALQRVTLEIPDFAFSLAYHAQKRLKFGGKYHHKLGNKSLQVEGVKEKAILWRGEMRDMLILGIQNERTNGSTGHEHPEPTTDPGSGDRLPAEPDVHAVTEPGSILPST